MQYVQGGCWLSYWLSNFLYDQIIFRITSEVCFAILSAFNIEAFLLGQNARTATQTLFRLYGLALIDFAYLLSFFFQDICKASSITFVVNFIAVKKKKTRKYSNIFCY